MATAPAAAAADAFAILHAPDLASAERAYLGLLPDLSGVSAQARRAVRLSRRADSAHGYALLMILIGMRLQELELDAAAAAEQRRAALRSLREAFAAR